MSAVAATVAVGKRAPRGRWLGAKALGAAALSAGLGGCATVPADVGENPKDPFERVNRQVFAFNEGLDKAVMAPVARAYQAVVPGFVRTGVDNFFGNLGDAWSALNLMLQAKPQLSLEMGLRTLTNSLLGVGGVLDVAGPVGLERSQVEDLGQTLGYWGLPAGPYLVLPLLGPSTLRDTAARPIDTYYSGPAMAFGHSRDLAGLTVLQLVSTRARLLSAAQLLDELALDKYTLLRDGFLSRRQSQVYDGDPPDDD